MLVFVGSCIILCDFFFLNAALTSAYSLFLAKEIRSLY